MLENVLRRRLLAQVEIGEILALGDASAAALNDKAEFTSMQLFLGLLLFTVIICVIAWHFEKIEAFFTRTLRDWCLRLIRGKGFAQRTASASCYWMPSNDLAFDASPVEEPIGIFEPTVIDLHEKEHVVPAVDVDETHQKILEELEKTKGSKSKSETESEREDVERSESQLASATVSLDRHGQGLAKSQKPTGSATDPLADSLQQKLELTEAELERQYELSATMQARIEAFENDAIDLKQRASRAESLSGELASLRQELVHRSGEFEQLKVSSVKAHDAVVLMDKAAEDAEACNQRLVRELSEATELEANAQAELKRARQSLESLTDELNEAQLERNRQQQLADRLSKEKETVRCESESLNKQLASAIEKTDQLSEAKESIEARLRSVKNEHLETKSRFDSAALKIAQLEAALASSKATVDQHAKEHLAETEALRAQIDEAEGKTTEAESHHRVALRQLESRLAAAETELASSRDRSQNLDSEIESLTVRAAEADALRDQLRSQRKTLEASEATRLEQETRLSQNEDQLQQSEQQAAAFQRDLAREQTLLADVQQMLKKESADNVQLIDLHHESEQRLAQTIAELEQERKWHAEQREESASRDEELKVLAESLEASRQQMSEQERQAKESKRQLADLQQERQQKLIAQAALEEAKAQLSADLELQSDRVVALESKLLEAQKSGEGKLQTQAAKYQTLEERLKGLKQQAEEAQQELAESQKHRERELVSRAELEEANMRLSTDLKREADRVAALQSQLEQQSQLVADLNALDSERKQVSRELDEMQAAFDREQSKNGDLVTQLQASDRRIAELQQQAATPVSDVAEVARLEEKIRKYKAIHAQNKEYLESLSEQGSAFHQRAVEYLEAGKILKSELENERKTSAKLKNELDKALASSSSKLSQSERDHLVQQASRNHVLSLKAQFEKAIKKKNQTIRELRNREMVERVD